MANTLNAIEDATLIARSLSSLVVASPQDTEGFTPQSEYETDEIFPKRMFLFDYEEGNEIDLESEITEHAVENGDTIGQSINNKPEVIRTTGYIGELTSNLKGGLGGEKINQLKQQARKLIVLSPYAPRLTATALSLLNQAEKLYRDAQMLNEIATQKWRMIGSEEASGGIVITGAESLAELTAKIKKGKNQTYQQKAFQELYSYWKKKTLFTVRTPYATFKNCAIASIRARQDDNSKHVSSFAITFRTFRLVDFDLVVDPRNLPINPIDSSSILKNQSNRYIDKGPVSVGEVIA